MYVADDLQRINVEGRTWGFDKPGVECDVCNHTATHKIPVYNPADGVRGVDGAYAIFNLCNEHFESEIFLEECYYCNDCGELFINNHSWDNLRVTINDEYYCHKCALNHIHLVPLHQLIKELKANKAVLWTRINGYPGKESIWSGEFSQWSDFSGYISLQSVARDILDAANGDDSILVYPLIIATYQFSLVLEVLKD